MAIYKLGDIAKVKMCKRVLSSQTSKIGGVPFYKIGTLGDVADSYISFSLYNELSKKFSFPEKGDSLITCSGTIGKIVEYDGYDAYFQDSNIVWLSTNSLLKKYLFLWLLKTPFMPTQGATIKRLYNSDIEKTEIHVPALEEQQKIIDIIEPIEDGIFRLEHIKNKITSLTTNLSSINFKKTNEKYTYLKGGNPLGVGKTLFLNVAAANKNANRFVCNEPNTFHGDVTLSLDGNTGLVNNSLYGFNGYLYKVTSKKHSNSEIYYSLKHKINQDIIKLNETGTTIKHSPNSKKEIIHLELSNKDLYKNCFELEIKINLLLEKLENLKSHLIRMLMK